MFNIQEHENETTGNFVPVTIKQKDPGLPAEEPHKKKLLKKATLRKKVQTSSMGQRKKFDDQSFQRCQSSFNAISDSDNGSLNRMNNQLNNLNKQITNSSNLKPL
jgi:hypothetical protein